MILNRPSFPISFTFESCTSLIEKIVKDHYWTDFSFASIKLKYVPYWFFNYDIFVESLHSERKEKIVSDHKFGSISLNALDGSLNEELALVIKDSKVERIREPVQGYEFEVSRPLILENKVEDIARIRLAKKFGVGLQNVVISGLRMIYVPEWILTVTVAEGNYQFNISAINGSILNEVEVPFRERGWIEVSKETISELKRPGAWIEYSKGVLSSAENVFGFDLFFGFFRKLAYNRNFQLGFLFVLLIVVVLAHLYGLI